MYIRNLVLAAAVAVVVLCSIPADLSAKEGAGQASLGLILGGLSGFELAGRYGLNEKLDLAGSYSSFAVTSFSDFTDLRLGAIYNHRLEKQELDLRIGGFITIFSSTVNFIGSTSASATGLATTIAVYKQINEKLEVGGGLNGGFVSGGSTGLFGEANYKVAANFGAGAVLGLGTNTSITARGILYF